MMVDNSNLIKESLLKYKVVFKFFFVFWGKGKMYGRFFFGLDSLLFMVFNR